MCMYTTDHTCLQPSLQVEGHTATYFLFVTAATDRPSMADCSPTIQNHTRLRSLQVRVVHKRHSWMLLIQLIILAWIIMCMLAACSGPNNVLHFLVLSSLVPRPLPSFPSLAIRWSGRGPGTCTWHYYTGQIRWMWASCKLQKNFARTHDLERDYSKSKDGSARRRFYVTLHETVGRTENFTTTK